MALNNASALTAREMLACYNARRCPLGSVSRRTKTNGKSGAKEKINEAI
jgi:hypothetical protein